MLFSNICDYSGALADEELCVSERYENNISKQILLGEKLRKIKCKTCPEIKEYQVIDIMPHNGKHQVANVNNSPSPSKNKRNKPRKKQQEHKEKCPLRVIELAYPSKRHCLETWKTRNKTLPIHMIDRLRKIINDENPKTPVRDAINFFERSKTKRRKRNVKTVNNNKRQEQLKLLCCYFGYQIMNMLEKPIHIELSSDLARVAHIVNEDVSDMLYNSEYQSLSGDDNEIQNDIIKKITVWIDGVLEESSQKLFLEELREIEEEQGPVLDLLDEVFYRASSNDVSKYSDENVEKYDGPIYIIPQQRNDEEYEDSINGINLKFPTFSHPDSDDASKKDAGPDERELVENILFNAMDHTSCETSETKKKNKVDDESSTLRSTDFKNIDSKHLRDYINIILIQIIEEACEKYLDKINKTSQHQTVNNENDIKIPINSDDSDVEFEKKFNTTKDSLVIRNTLDLVTKSEINLDNIVNRSEEVKSLETSDDGNKKVKFNNNDIDNSMELAKTKASHLSSENHLPILKTRSVTIYNDKISKTIYLSNPNPFLLSEADESWPESSSFHNRGSLVKVSKSVVSLGELLEREEGIFPQSVKGSVEILNYILSSNNKVAKENNVSIPSILNKKDNINTKPNLEKENVAKDENNTRQNIFHEAIKLNSRQIHTLLTDKEDEVRNEEENPKSALMIPDIGLTYTKTLNQKRKTLNVKKLSNINIVQETCNDDMTVRVRTSRQTQYSPELLNKRTQTKRETLNNYQQTTPETGFNISTEEIDNIVGHLETWLFWIRNITAEVENLLKKESGGENWSNINNKIEFDSKSCIRRVRDLHERLEILISKYNNLKVMPYKCNCNKNIHNRKYSKHFL